MSSNTNDQHKARRYVVIDGIVVPVAGCSMYCPLCKRTSIPSDRYDEDGEEEDPEVFYECMHPNAPKEGMNTTDESSWTYIPKACPLKKIKDLKKSENNKEMKN
jgi:hypothetical protein